MTRKISTVYIAGPMRGRPFFGFPEFDAARDKLLDAGYKVLSPVDLDRANGFDAMLLPATTDWNKLPEGVDFEECVTRDIQAVRDADAVVTLPGWEDSPGARAEVALAQWLRKPTYGLAVLLWNDNHPLAAFEPGDDLLAYWDDYDCGFPAPNLTETVKKRQFLPTSGVPAQPVKRDGSADFPATSAPVPPENPVVSEKSAAVSDELKPTNPKELVGSSKLPLSLWPPVATAYGCLGFLEGALKYGRANFRALGVRASIYVDAARRHLDAWFEGEECAPDTGTPHLANALACIAIILDAQSQGKLTDDRNYTEKPSAYRDAVNRLTPQVKKLQEQFKHCAPKHYAKEGSL